MKNQSFIALILFCVALAAQAGYAGSGQVGTENDWYVNFNTTTDYSSRDSSNNGFYTPEDFIETNDDFSASFGYRLSGNNGEIGNTRIEAEFLWHDSAFTDTKINTDSMKLGMMANVLYDFNTDSSVIPYFGIGAGAASIKAVGADSADTTGNTHNVPAYQTMAGVLYTSHLYPYTSIQIGYRYFSTIAPINDYSSHNLDAGVRVTF